jgi:hypothetical protein
MALACDTGPLMVPAILLSIAAYFVKSDCSGEYPCHMIMNRLFLNASPNPVG